MASTPISDPQKVYADAVAAALKKAKITGYAADDLLSKVGSTTSNFIPGLEKEYNAWLDAQIAASIAEHGPSDATTGYYTALKSIYNTWAKQHPTFETLDLSKAASQDPAKIKATQDLARKILADETASLTDTTKAEIGSYSSLYGAKGTEASPAKGSVAYNYNSAKATLDKTKAALDAANASGKKIPKAQAAYDKALAAYTPLETSYNKLKDTQSGSMTAMQNALFTTAMNYNKNAGTPFTNFLQGIETPVVKPGATQAETDAEVKAAAEATTNANVNKALEEYKKTDKKQLAVILL